MALGDVLIKGKLKIEGTTEMAGFAKDTTLITNLNADQIDSADKDTDGALTANSDAKIPSQKAVKTYADARKAECVQLTGDQTIAGVKTLSSIPILPASDPTTDNQAVRKAYIDNVVRTTGDQTIDGIKTFSKQPVMTLGNKVNAGTHGNVSENVVFDQLSPFIPNTNNMILVSGGIGAVTSVSFAKRTGSSTIIFYGMAASTRQDLTITDGSSTVHETI